MFRISDTIKKLMIDRKIKVTVLAEKIGIKQQALSRKLNNSSESYTLDYLQSVVAAMGCDIVISVVDRGSGQTLYTIKEDEKSL